jgi:hypothetical protein
MPRQVTFTAYKLDELSPKARAHAIETEREALGQDYDGSRLTEMFAEMLGEKGFPTNDIRWSLSSSQGDGVAFYGPIDLDIFLKSESAQNRLSHEENKICRELLNDGVYDSQNPRISKRGAFHSYDHWNTMVLEGVDCDVLESPWRTEIKNAVLKLEALLKNEIIET